VPFNRAPASRHPTGKYRKSSRTLAGRPVISFKLLTGHEEGGSAQPTSPLPTHLHSTHKEGENLSDPVYFTR